MLQLSQGGSCGEQMPEECSDVLRRESEAVRSKEGTLVSVQAGLCGAKRSEGYRSGYRAARTLVRDNLVPRNRDNIQGDCKVAQNGITPELNI